MVPAVSVALAAGQARVDARQLLVDRLEGRVEASVALLLWREPGLATRGLC